MGFARGLTAIKQDVSCGPCLDGSHTSCEYLQLMEEINHNAHADEASSMVYFRPTCGCFITDEKRHYDYELDEGWVEAMEPEAKPEPCQKSKTEVETWTTWEAYYSPFPAVVQELGFEEILDRITDAVEADSSPLRRWGDVGLSGRLNRVVAFEVTEPDQSDSASALLSAQARPEDFQRDVGLLMAKLGLEGHVLIHVSFNVMRPVEYDGDESGD